MAAFSPLGVAQRHAVAVLWTGWFAQRHHSLNPRQLAILSLNRHFLLSLVVQVLIILLLLSLGRHPLHGSFFPLLLLIKFALSVTLLPGSLFGLVLPLSLHFGGLDVVSLGFVLDFHVPEVLSHFVLLLPLKLLLVVLVDGPLAAHLLQSALVLHSLVEQVGLTFHVVLQRSVIVPSIVEILHLSNRVEV